MHTSRTHTTAHRLVSLAPLSLCASCASQTNGQPPNFRDGGSFIGTYAYDAGVGYGYGQFDDNGRSRMYYLNNRERKPRMPGKRLDPGDFDFFDPYYDGYLYNDRTLGDYNDLRGSLRHHGMIGRRLYWHDSQHIPLRYDNYNEYQRFTYELGGDDF